MAVTNISWPTCSAAQFAALFKVTPQAVTAWLDAGMPCVRGRGNGHAVKIDPTLAAPWVLARREPIGSQRERLAKEQADRHALENATKRGELLKAEHVSDVLTSLAADLGSQLDALPGRCAGELAGINEPGVIRSRLLDETRSIRAAVADAVAKLAQPGADSDDDGGDIEAAEETDGGPVGERKPRAAARKRGAGAVA